MPHETVAKPNKPVFRTVSPFALPTLSVIEQPHHDRISDLLLTTLAPIGLHRQRLPKSPSKKRCKTRKWKAASAAGDAETVAKTSAPETPPPEHASAVCPSPPKVIDDVLIGFNSITRHLENLSRYSRRSSLLSHNKESSQGEKPRHVTAVYLLRPMDNVIFSHLPVLCQTASLAYPDLPATRFILLDPSLEKNISAALVRFSSKISTIALLEGAEEESPKALSDYVREHVPAVEVPWIKQNAEGRWLGTEISQ